MKKSISAKQLLASLLAAAITLTASACSAQDLDELSELAQNVDTV